MKNITHHDDQYSEDTEWKIPIEFFECIWSKYWHESKFKGSLRNTSFYAKLKLDGKKF